MNSSGAEVSWMKDAETIERIRRVRRSDEKGARCAEVGSPAARSGVPEANRREPMETGSPIHEPPTGEQNQRASLASPRNRTHSIYDPQAARG